MAASGAFAGQSISSQAERYRTFKPKRIRLGSDLNLAGPAA